MKQIKFIFLLAVFAASTFFIRSENYSKLNDLSEHPERTITLNSPNGGWETLQGGLFDSNRNLKKNISIYHTLASNEKIIFKVNYATDSFGRRITHKLTRHDQHLIFMGSSDIFGWGLDAENTLSYYVQNRVKKFSVYNYSIPGGSASNFLKKFEDHTIAQEIEEKSGILLYFYIDGHVDRFFGKISGFNENFPNFTLENGTWINRGTFAESEPVFSYIKKIITTSLIYETFEMENLNFASPERFLTYCEAIVEMKKRYLNIFKNGRFVLAFHPMESATSGLVKKCLAENQVEIFESNFEISPTDRIPSDDHPSAAFNRKYAFVLSAYLNSLSDIKK